MLKILSSVAESKLGFSFGKPLRVEEKSLAVVLPILRETSISRQYVTFPETEKVHVFDTGKIDQMEADNKGEDNVFVRSGTLFRGATQERALLRSAVLFPGKKQSLGVRCVHQTRGINPNAKVTYGGLTPHAFDAMNYSHGYTPKSQHEYWTNAVKSTSAMNAAMGKNQPQSRLSSPRRRSSPRAHTTPLPMGASFAQDIPITAEADTAFYSAFNTSAKSDDLYSTFQDFSMHFDEILSKVKLVDNQAGLALINQNGVETIEFFDHKDSWKALHESAVKRLGSNIVSKDGESVFEYKPENAIKQVNRILGMDWQTNNIFRHRPSNGEPEVEITGLSADRYVGEAVEVNGSLIHLVILRKSE